MPGTFLVTESMREKETNSESTHILLGRGQQSDAMWKKGKQVQGMEKDAHGLRQSGEEIRPWRGDIWAEF